MLISLLNGRNHGRTGGRITKALIHSRRTAAVSGPAGRKAGLPRLMHARSAVSTKPTVCRGSTPRSCQIRPRCATGSLTATSSSATTQAATHRGR